MIQKLAQIKQNTLQHKNKNKKQMACLQIKVQGYSSLLTIWRILRLDPVPFSSRSGTGGTVGWWRWDAASKQSILPAFCYSATQAPISTQTTNYLLFRQIHSSNTSIPQYVYFTKLIKFELRTLLLPRPNYIKSIKTIKGLTQNKLTSTVL